MITDKDVKKLEKTFATKKDLEAFATKKDLTSFATKKYVDKRFERLFVYLDNRFEPLEKMKIDFDKFKDRVYTSLDWLVNAFKKFDEEHIVLTEQNKRTNGKLDNHEVRIFGLEQRVTTP